MPTVEPSGRNADRATMDKRSSSQSRSKGSRNRKNSGGCCRRSSSTPLPRHHPQPQRALLPGCAGEVKKGSRVLGQLTDWSAAGGGGRETKRQKRKRKTPKGLKRPNRIETERALNAFSFRCLTRLCLTYKLRLLSSPPLAKKSPAKHTKAPPNHPQQVPPFFSSPPPPVNIDPSTLGLT